MQTSQTHDLLSKATEILDRNGEFRVWSVIVTLFGDLARNHGDQISGALLSRLTESMGIKPQAMRVALHRLRKDGWITSEKTGRTVRYSLSDTGFSESLAARPRIYGAKPEMPEIWHLLIAQPMAQARRIGLDQAHISRGYLAINPGVLLGKGKLPQENPEYLGLEGGLLALPNWLRTSSASADITKGYASLDDNLSQIDRLLENTPELSPLEAAALRILIIHNWRRLLLRHADLPAEFYPENWPGLACRGCVMALLQQLKRPSLQELSL